MTGFYSKAGADLPREASALEALLRRFIEDRGRDLVLHPAPLDGARWIGEARFDDLPLGTGTLSLYTGGTTGAPKAHTHPIGRLLDKPGRGSSEDAWLLCYAPVRWAGLSVIAHTVKTGARLVVPGSLAPEDLLEAWPRATHVSLTPSLFRKLVATDRGDMQRGKLRQLTFGGEWASQRVLDMAREIFPDARVSHVYAATELGDVCSVSDGLAGYPPEKMGAFELTETGELVVDGVRDRRSVGARERPPTLQGSGGRADQRGRCARSSVDRRGGRPEPSPGHPGARVRRCPTRCWARSSACDTSARSRMRRCGST